LILCEEYQKSTIDLVDKDKLLIAEISSIHRPKNPGDLQAQDGEKVGPHWLLSYDILLGSHLKRDLKYLSWQQLIPIMKTSLYILAQGNQEM